MNLSKILAEIDQEIARLEQAKALLSGNAAPKKRGGRPAASAAASAPAPAGKRKRNISPEGRKRIAEAVKKRWERQRKGNAKS
jgi:hypothetical protein